MTDAPSEEEFRHHWHGPPGFAEWLTFLESYDYASPEVIKWLASIGPYPVTKIHGSWSRKEDSKS